MKEIQLTRGYVALVDDEDFEMVNSFKWCALVISTRYISAKRKPSKSHPFVLMSRMILNITDPKVYVDHKDRNPLNNQRSNLRICNAAQNNYNTTSAKNSSSKYLGVSWDKSRNKWQTKIMQNYRTIHLGRYNKEEEAALAYNQRAIVLFGEFASLNQV